MTTRKGSARGKVAEAARDEADESSEMGKAELERQLAETRESLSQTVHEIRETVTGQYEAVRETVTGVIDYREQFQKEPLVWSLGALSAGFALGYTLGYAHKNSKTSKAKHSQIAAFADSLAGELSTVGKTFVMPTLNYKIKELFGFDFADVLNDMGKAKTASPKRKTTKGLPRKRATRKVAKKKTAGK
ncbi:MAG: hypothetical protein H7Z16_06750 [Pyrinomonadaceae bacterium]|nr:hypothetical protein [Pyrinomonadaceae bacterium]